jgi:SAM-dependent methyltransferase
MSPDAYLDMVATEDTHWWYTARRAILATVIESLALPANAKILEVGVGTGGNIGLLSGFGRVSGVEMNTTALALAKTKAAGRAELLQGHCPDAIPFVDERFDLICLFDVLEHIEDDTETLKQLQRRLRPGGRLLITVPAYAWLWSQHDAFMHHHRRYTATSLQQVIARAGLKTARMTYFNTLLAPMIMLARALSALFKAKALAGVQTPAAVINRLLHGVFISERGWLKLRNLPFGISLLAVIVAD